MNIPISQKETPTAPTAPTTPIWNCRKTGLPVLTKLSLPHIPTIPELSMSSQAYDDILGSIHSLVYKEGNRETLLTALALVLDREHSILWEQPFLESKIKGIKDSTLKGWIKTALELSGKLPQYRLCNARDLNIFLSLNRGASSNSSSSHSSSSLKGGARGNRGNRDADFLRDEDAEHTYLEYANTSQDWRFMYYVSRLLGRQVSEATGERQLKVKKIWDTYLNALKVSKAIREEGSEATVLKYIDAQHQLEFLRDVCTKARTIQTMDEYQQDCIELAISEADRLVSIVSSIDLWEIS